MIKAIMAVDEEWGFSKNGSMPWPKNIEDLKHFKEMTLNGVVIMGRLTWEDPKMPTPLKNRINVLVTSKSPNLFPGADRYISGNLITNIQNLISEYEKKNIWIIGGSNLIEQAFDIIDVFFITRIRGTFNCDKKLNMDKINKNMNIYKSNPSIDNTCYFQVWKKNSHKD